MWTESMHKDICQNVIFDNGNNLNVQQHGNSYANSDKAAGCSDFLLRWEYRDCS